MSDLLSCLRTTMAQLRPKETSYHRQHTAHLPAHLQACTFVFVRHDAHRSPLQCTYDGPFRVLERSAKYFTLDLNGRRDTVSIDRLKPAFLDADIGVFDGTRLQQPYPPRPTLPPSPQVKATHSSQVRHSVPAPSPTTYADACRPLRIVGRSRQSGFQPSGTLSWPQPLGGSPVVTASD